MLYLYLSQLSLSALPALITTEICIFCVVAFDVIPVITTVYEDLECDYLAFCCIDI